MTNVNASCYNMYESCFTFYSLILCFNDIYRTMLVLYIAYIKVRLLIVTDFTESSYLQMNSILAIILYDLFHGNEWKYISTYYVLSCTYFNDSYLLVTVRILV